MTNCCEQYDPSNIRKVLLSLHPHLPLTSILPALRDLVNLIRHDVESRSFFVHSDGLLTLLELLLQFDDLVVVELTLSLSNCVCGDDSLLLRDAAQVGLAGEIFKFADAVFPLTVRLEAARFLQSMAFASVQSRDSLIQCQGLKYIVMLLGDGERKSLELKEIAVSCLGRAMESQRSLESKLMRMLCMADLSRHLIVCLSSVHQTCSRTPLDDIPATPEAMPTTTVSMTRKSYSSADSISEPCVPGTPSEMSSCTECPRESSDTSMSMAAPSNTQEASDSLRSNQKSQLERVQILSDKIMNLLLKISTSESEVHGHLLRPRTLQQFLLLVRLSLSLCLTVS